MAELLVKEPLFNGKTELDQPDKTLSYTLSSMVFLVIHLHTIVTSFNLLQIFRTLGIPNEQIWPGFAKLPGLKASFVKRLYNKPRDKFPATCFFGLTTLSEAGFDLLNKLPTYDPEKHITAEAALNHAWFHEVPLPKSIDFMPTFPTQHAEDRRLQRIINSPPDPLEVQ